MAFLHLVLAELDKIYKYDNFCFLLKEAELMLMERMFYPPCSPGTPTCGSTIGPLGLSAISPATPQHPLLCAAPRSARPAALSAVASGWWWWEVTPLSSPRSQPGAQWAPLQGEQHRVGTACWRCPWLQPQRRARCVPRRTELLQVEVLRS